MVIEKAKSKALKIVPMNQTILPRESLFEATALR
jgi:hypothetical protein